MKLRNLFAFAAILFLAACNDDETPAPSGIGGSMQATIDGMAWAATAVYLNQPASSSLQIIGERTPTPSTATGIGISISGFSGVDTYLVTTNADAYYSDAGSLYTGDTGQIVVTQSDDTWLKGNFNFTASDSLNTSTKIISGNFSYRKK